MPKYRYGEIEAEDLIGMVTGLAWTDVGGELLTIEGVMMPGKGKMTVTGNLRDVMKESISAAASYVRSRAVAFGIEPPLFDKRDIHVHVPEGATPKDGPSAGVAMVTAIVSVMTGIPVRRDVAMTGEITLRGRVLPIGGLKEKLLAASRGGMKTVLIPEENAKDLVEISDTRSKRAWRSFRSPAWTKCWRARWCVRWCRSNGRRRAPSSPRPPPPPNRWSRTTARADRALSAAARQRIWKRRRKAPFSFRWCTCACAAMRKAINIGGQKGRLAQLVERLLYTQDVGGSSPSSPTSLRFFGKLRLGRPSVAKAAAP